MNMFLIIICYPSLGFLIVSTLVYIVCRRHYYFIYDHRLLFVVGLVFSRSLTYYAIVDMLMWYLTDHEVPFVRSAVLSNIQEALSSLFVIFMAHSADSFVGPFRTILFSTTSFISVRLPLSSLFSTASRLRANTGSTGSSWMGGEVLPIIPLSCLQAGGGRVSSIWESQGAGGGRLATLATAPGVTVVDTSFLAVQKKIS
ncbi:hypothetical protein Hanom_Chr10g00894641 [Helianthus anomalus]